MNRLSLTCMAACISLHASASAQTALTVGAASQDTAFSLFDGNTNSLTAERLSAYEGKVVALFYFTPW